MDLYCPNCDMQVDGGHFDLYHRCWKCRARLVDSFGRILNECPACGEVQIMPEGVTTEMVLAVRRAECMMRGHSWNVIETLGSGPVAVKCSHCGEDSGLRRVEKAADVV